MTREQYFEMRDERNKSRDLYESAWTRNSYHSQVKQLDEKLEQHERENENDQHEYRRLSSKRN